MTAPKPLPDSAPSPAAARQVDLPIVGAGFAGRYMLHKARCLGLSAQAVEAAGGVGGTWYFNRYPGAPVDIQSLAYSFGFDDALQQDWHWTERYSRPTPRGSARATGRCGAVTGPSHRPTRGRPRLQPRPSARPGSRRAGSAAGFRCWARLTTCCSTPGPTRWRPSLCAARSAQRCLTPPPPACLSIQQKRAGGPLNCLGLMVAGFPNLFNVAGPGSPSAFTNVIVSIKHHVEWIADCITHLDRQGLTTIEPTVEAETAWVAHVNAVAAGTVLLSCNSWHLGANIPGKPRLFMPLVGFPPYVARCAAVAAAAYPGFKLDARRALV